jgi:TonB family protein
MVDKKDDIEGYNKGSLSEKERHALEKKALNDPFLADALEGAESISSEDFSADVLELSKQIERNRLGWFTPLRIAASVLMLIGAGSLFYYFSLSEPTTLALERSANPVPADSVIASLKDSSSNFLTLAKPEETEREKEKSSNRSTGKTAADKSDLPKVSSSSTGAGAETQPVITIAKADEEKQPIVESEIVLDEQQKVVSAQEAPAVTSRQLDDQKDQSAINKKEARARKANAFSPDGSLPNQRQQISQQITGNVISSDDGGALPGVNVVVKGTNTGTVTDNNGNFEINTDVTKPQLVFSYIGMNTVEAEPKSSNSVNVKMKEDASQLSEVVVTALGVQESDKDREPVVKSAAPVGGLRAYNKYLEKNLRYPAEALEQKIKGKVLIEFTVETNGDLSEFNVVKSLGHGCDEEVIRLVKEGPKWSPTTQDDVPVEAQVKVRMKFDPAKAEK